MHLPLPSPGVARSLKAAMCLAVPGRILEVTGEDAFFRTARVSFGGIVKQVSLACVPEARVNDYVLVHVGMALNVVDEKEAAVVFSYLKEMGEIEEATPAPSGAPPR
jgi:hydrogenase expression/formation protein HypC